MTAPPDPAPTMKRCPYCSEEVQFGAIICKHCRKEIGPGHALKAAGQKMTSLGCALTLLITIPVIVFVLVAGSC